MRLFACAVLIVVQGAAAQWPAKKQDAPVLLKGATVHTVVGDRIAGGNVLLVDGKIKAVGKDVRGPEGTRVINLTGKHVYPGLIAATSILGLTEIGSVRATQDSTEVGDMTPEVRAEVAVNPDSLHIPVARANGIALAHTLPQGGLISGTSALIMLDGWTWEDMTKQSPTGIHVRWPSMGESGRRSRRRRSTSSPEEQRKRRDRQLDQIRETFANARAYANAKASDDKPRTDRRYEALLPVFQKNMRVFVHANELRQIESAVDWADDAGVALVLVGGRDAWRCTALLKERDIPVIVTSTHRLPGRRFADYDAPFTLPKKLHAAGVRFCISGSSSESANLRNVPYQAATAAAYGLPKAEALRALTLYPAQILGVGATLGSIEPGKDATLIVTNGDPLEIRTNVEHMFIRGRQVDLDSHHKKLYRKYKEKYRRLGLLDK